MASNDQRPNPGRRGVRGPRGPQSAATSARKPAPRVQGDMSGFQRASLPLLTRLTHLPKWVLVIVMATLLVLGIIQTGYLAWLGALLLGILTLFFLWLLVLSWPAIPTTGRVLRGIVVVALAGATVLKAMGRL